MNTGVPLYESKLPPKPEGVFLMCSALVLRFHHRHPHIGLKLPRRLIVNYQIPDYAPGLWNSVIDGEGYSMVFCYTMCEDVQDAFASGNGALMGPMGLLQVVIKLNHYVRLLTSGLCP